MEMKMKIALKDVASVYVGRAGRCCCGCSGRHRYAVAHRKASSKRRGYAVDNDEINDRQVKKVVGILEANPAAVDIHNGFISLEQGDKMYVAYFVKR
jgi:hypothetical protein